MSTKLKFIQKEFNDSIKPHEFNIPIDLKDIIITTIHQQFNTDNTDGRYLRKIQNYIDFGLYLVLYILYCNHEKILKMQENNDSNCIFNFEKYKQYDCEIGCQVSKEVLCACGSTRLLYTVKDLLIKHDILILKPFMIKKDGTPVYYSKRQHQALRYAINAKYLYYKKYIPIENKYMDRLLFYSKYRILYGEYKNLVFHNMNPYTSNIKNIQYNLQRELTFDEDKFKKVYLEKYPVLKNIDNVWEKLDDAVTTNNNPLNFSAKMMGDYLLFFNVNHHIFRATESNGRIYMPLQYMSKEYRSALLYHGLKLKEVYDMKCCFVQLAAMLYQQQTHDKANADKLSVLAVDDIYTTIALKEHIDRDSAKSYLMKFLFETPFIRELDKQKVGVALKHYFSKIHPQFYKWLNEYPQEYRNEEDEFGNRKRVSLLSKDCCQLESDLMFNYVLPELISKHPDIPLFSLHDGIWSTENIELNLTNEIKKIVNRYNSNNTEESHG